MNTVQYSQRLQYSNRFGRGGTNSPSLLKKVDTDPLADEKKKLPKQH
jgi:hypothetical protein